MTTRNEAIGPGELRQLLTAIAETVENEEAHLNGLDAALGDGDHGISMRLGFQAIVKNFDRLDSSASIGQILRESGMAFMGATGGAIGVVMGKMLIEGGKALQDVDQIGVNEFPRFLAAMQVSIGNGGKVRPGDKTILDAVEAARISVEGRQFAQGFPEMVAVAAASSPVGRAANRPDGMQNRAGKPPRRANAWPS